MTAIFHIKCDGCDVKVETKMSETKSGPNNLSKLTMPVDWHTIDCSGVNIDLCKRCYLRWKDLSDPRLWIRSTAIDR